MNDEQNNQSEDKNTDSHKPIETNLDFLFQKARSLPEFKKYTDLELKEKLVDLVFSQDLAVNHEDKELDEEEIQEKKTSNILLKLSSTLQKDRQNKDRQIKNNILASKTETISKLKDNLSIIYDLQSINDILFKLSAEAKLYNNDVFWDFYQYNDSDIQIFKKKLSSAHYISQTSFFIKLWDIISGSRNEKIQRSDPFLNVSIFPKPKRSMIYGNNYYRSKIIENSWSTLLFGINNDFPPYIPIEQSFNYSLKGIITSLSNHFDYIFRWTDIHFIQKDPENSQPITNPTSEIINEGLFFKLISESFVPIFKILTIFEHIAYSLPLTENHSLRSGHLIYFIAWIYVNWIPFLDKSLKETKNYSSSEGETGKISLKLIFDQIKNDMDNEIVSIDFEYNLNSFYDYFSEREEILKKIDYFTGYIPELKRRIKILLNTLIADHFQDYYSSKDYYMIYHIDDRGRIYFDDLFRKKRDSLLAKFLSIFQGKDKDKPKSALPETKKEIKEMSPQTTPQKKVSYSTTKDYSSYIRILGDLISSITILTSCFNDNFSEGNKLIPHLDKKIDDKYQYLKRNPMFSTLDEVPFDQVMALQDCFDLMHTAKARGEDLEKSIKLKEIPRNINHKISFVEDTIDNLITSVKDTSGTLGILTEDKNKYQEYGELFKKLQYIYTELQKIEK